MRAHKPTAVCVAGLADSGEDLYCSNYSRILDSEGNDILKGLIAFDGCNSMTLTEARTPAPTCHNMT